MAKRERWCTCANPKPTTILYSKDKPVNSTWCNRCDKPWLSDDNIELYNRVKSLYPEGWFIARNVKTPISKLDILVRANLLDKSKGIHGSGTQFKVR